VSKPRRQVQHGDLAVAVAGLALHRTYLSGTDDEVAAIRSALRRACDALDADAAGLPIEELPAAEGYAAWAATYDGNGSDLMYEFEERAVRTLLDELPRGSALDAACGTGRHLSYLEARGHRISGFDGSPEMLAVARGKAPAAELAVGTLDAIPWTDGSFDVVVCALALAHLPDLTPAIAELARVLRPGGRLVISDPHPTRVLLDGQALFFATPAAGAFVRNHVHLHGEYLDAFRAAGLIVRRCVEPVVAPRSGPLRDLLGSIPEQVALLAYGGIPMALVWELART
jgi:ubiquinone/menaquinone biosynthesis C-methylase UbiE